MITSAKTSINKNKVPALFKHIPWRPGTMNLDLGGGRYDTATEYLRVRNVINKIYDPYNRTQEENEDALSHTYDTVTISNVLNVIPSYDARIDLLKLALNHVKKGGTIYIKVYEGNGSGKGNITQNGESYQANRVLKDFMENEVREVFSKHDIKYDKTKGVIHIG